MKNEEHRPYTKENTGKAGVKKEYMSTNAFLYSVGVFFTKGKGLFNPSGFEFPFWFVNIHDIFVAPDGFL